MQNVFGHFWPKRRTRIVRQQLTRHRQESVSRRFCVQPLNVLPPEQVILGIDLVTLGVMCRLLPIRGGQQNHAMHMLNRPATLAELASKPVEQFRMGRLSTAVIRNRSEWPQAAHQNGIAKFD